MNQNIKKYIPAIYGIASMFCSFLSFIFIIVFNGNAWDYVSGILTFIAICQLLILVILDLLTIKFDKLSYFIPLGIIILVELFGGLEALIRIGDVHSSLRYSYFNNFIDAMINIFVIALFAYSIYKSKHIITGACTAYLAGNLFVSGLYSFIRTFFSLFTADKFKYGFNNFMTYSAMFLFYAIYIWLVYENSKSDKRM